MRVQDRRVRAWDVFRVGWEELGNGEGERGRERDGNPLYKRIIVVIVIYTYCRYIFDHGSTP